MTYQHKSNSCCHTNVMLTPLAKGTETESHITFSFPQKKKHPSSHIICFFPVILPFPLHFYTYSLFHLSSLNHLHRIRLLDGVNINVLRLHHRLHMALQRARVTQSAHNQHHRPSQTQLLKTSYTQKPSKHSCTAQLAATKLLPCNFCSSGCSIGSCCCRDVRGHHTPRIRSSLPLLHRVEAVQGALRCGPGSLTLIYSEVLFVGQHVVRVEHERPHVATQSVAYTKLDEVQREVKYQATPHPHSHVRGTHRENSSAGG